MSDEPQHWMETARRWMALSRAELRDGVQQRIREAFDEVSLGEGISLSETIAVDEYHSDPEAPERQRRRALDARWGRHLPRD